MFNNLVSTLGGLSIVVNHHLLKEVPRFPDKKRTKRRYRRVVGKHGSWTYYCPTMYRMGNTLICHPKIYAKLQKHSAQQESNV